MSLPVLFARQPIFDQHMNVYAYQLLYRDNEGFFPVSDFDGVAASTEVLVNAFSNVLEKGGVKYLPALINFEAAWLYDGMLPTVPDEILILDVERDAEVTDSVLESLQQLSQQGYRLSVSPKASEELLQLASIIKVDLQQYSETELTALVETFSGRILLAEKIESYQQFELCQNLGFTLFLGYFFAKPSYIAGRKLSRNELVMLQLIGEVYRSDVSPEEIEEIIQRDPELVTGLLRLVNSAAFRGRRTVSNIREAIIVLGLVELRKWILIISLTRNSSKPQELIRTLLIRAKMCQLIAGRSNVDANTAFLTGLLSGLDALVDLPMDEVLEQLPVQVDVKRALTGGANPLGILLTAVKNYQIGEWLDEDPDDLQLLQDSQLQALEWSNEILMDLP